MLAEEGRYVSQIATLERNAWTLDGLQKLYADDVEPYWSASLSGEDCVLDPAPVITLTLDGQYTSLGVTLLFDTGAYGGYCSEVLIDWYRDGALLTEKAFTPNAGVYFLPDDGSSG